MSEPNDTDREVAEACRNSTTRVERVSIVATYREEREKAERERVIGEVETWLGIDALHPAWMELARKLRGEESWT